MTCDDECCCGKNCGNEDNEDYEEVEGVEDFEEGEVDILEFTLDEDEINELIEKLVELKETKTSCIFEIDDENGFIINYGEDSEEEEE